MPDRDELVEEWDVSTLLDEFTSPEMPALICVDGRLVSRTEDAERRLAALPEADPGRSELAREIVELYDQIKSTERTFLIRGVGDFEWSELIGQHPPIEGDFRSFRLGYNPQTFPQAALARCCVTPKLTVEQALELRKKLVPSQWARLWAAVEGVHLAADGDGLGKSLPVSTQTLASETRSATAPSTASPTPSSSGE